MSSNQPPPGPYGQQPPQGPYGQQPPQGPYGPPPAPGQYGPPQGPPGSGGQQPDYLDGPAPEGSRKRGIVLLAAVAAVAVVGAGAVFAVQTFSGGGARPADVIPGTAVAYAQFDLDPSAEQKVNLLRLLRDVPDFEETTGITSDRDDLRQLAFEEILSDLDCDLDYADDVEPWIGDRAGVAAWPRQDDSKAIPVIAVQVRDEEQAQDAVSTLEECSTDAALPEDTDAAAESADLGVDFVGDYMLLTEEASLEDVVQESADSPLSDTDGFSADMDALDEQGVMSFWVDIPALLEVPEVASELEASDQDMSYYDDYDSAFGAVRAGSNYIELAAMGRGGSIVLEADGDNPVTELPESTLSALSVSGGGMALEENWDEILSFLDSASDGEAQDEIDAFETESGFAVPEDVSTLLGDNLTIALDGEGLSPENLQDPSDFAKVGFGARFTTDPDAIRDLIDRVQALLSEQGVPVELSTQDTDDGLVLASNDEYADRLATGGSLGDSDTFRAAVPEAAGATCVYYLDVEQAATVVADFGGGEEADRIGSIKAVGVSGSQDESLSSMSFRVVFDD